MSSKLYLTIAAVLAILYGIGFVLIPAKMGELYGVQPEPHAILNVQYFGSALLAWGVIMWFARDLDWAAVRGVLIGSVVGDAVGGLLSVWGISQGLVNAFGWTSVVIYVLLLLGALYFLSPGSRKRASVH
jgi:uncharacterized membrane protein YfcA